MSVQQLEWPEEDEKDDKEEGEEAGGAGVKGGMAAGATRRRGRRHGVIHRVEPVPPTRCVACVRALVIHVSQTGTDPSP